MSIVVTGVSKQFGEYAALTDVSLEVPTGGLVALLGPSGCGKSTLLRIIAGLDQADTGSIRIAGRDAMGVAPQRRAVGFVFQHYAAFKHLTVAENVAFGLKVKKVPRGEVRDRVEEMLRLVRLEQYAQHYPSQLSGGQRQRMALARALAIHPQVLLLDEPFGALDARVRQDLRAWLRRLHDEVGVTTVLVTHDQEEAMEIADTIALMNQGRIVQVGSPTQLYDEPADEFVMGLLGPVNRVGDRYIRPHEVGLSRDREGQWGATVQRVIGLGVDSAVDLLLTDGQTLRAMLRRTEAQDLVLVPGDRVTVSLDRARSFPAHAGPSPAAAVSGR